MLIDFFVLNGSEICRPLIVHTYFHKFMCIDGEIVGELMLTFNLGLFFFFATVC